MGVVPARTSESTSAGAGPDRSSAWTQTPQLGDRPDELVPAVWATTARPVPATQETLGFRSVVKDVRAIAGPSAPAGDTVRASTARSRVDRTRSQATR